MSRKYKHCRKNWNTTGKMFMMRFAVITLNEIVYDKTISKLPHWIHLSATDCFLVILTLIQLVVAIFGKVLQIYLSCSALHGNSKMQSHLLLAIPTTPHERLTLQILTAL